MSDSRSSILGGNMIEEFLKLRNEDFNIPQKVKCLNDSHKLNYDKDSFLRFYKFKQSLQS